MTESDRFLSTSDLDDLFEAKVGGQSSIDLYDAVEPRLRLVAGEDVCNLFARPSVMRGNGVRSARVSWTTKLPGEALQWKDAPAEERDRVAARLGALAAPLAAALADPEIGPTIATRLNVPSLAVGLNIIGGRPVIATWGLLPKAVAETPEDRERHFRSGIGRFFPGFAPPPLEVADMPQPDPGAAETAASVAPAAVAATAIGAATRAAAAPNAVAATEEGTQLPLGPPSAAVEPDTTAAATDGAGTSTSQATIDAARATTAPEIRRPWLIPSIATMVAALVLLVLWLPGTLWPAPAVTPGVSDDTARQIVDTLRDRRRQLEQALDRPDSCEIVSPPATPRPGAQTPPRDVRAPTDPSVPRGGTPSAVASPEAPAPDAPAPLLPPAASDVRVPRRDGGDAARQPDDLVGFLDKATVLVLARKAGSDQTSLGSGFFVSDRHVVTNRHVVESGDRNGILVARPGMTAPVGGRVVAMTDSSEIGGDDFAVVEIPPEAARTALSLTTGAGRRTEVVAAGYPAFVLATDAAFTRFVEGHGERIPEAVITQGAVMALQQAAAGGGAELVVHSATISQGNSGGPLVDLCGRVIGVNTFGRNEGESALHLNFALHSGGLLKFLRARGIPVNLDDGPCRPRVAETDATASPPAPGEAPRTPPASNAPPAGPRVQ